ncbi:MAG: hypothetical protein NZO58_07215 [Gemmataceae bacterium]|nr:hypothetical protein [Gemmataceae bacterium]
MSRPLLALPSSHAKAAIADAGVGNLWQRLFQGVSHFDVRPDWEELAGPRWRDTILHLPVTDNYHAKQGRSTGRLVLERSGRRLTVYLKRHYRLPWRHGWLATFWPAGAWSPGMAEKKNLIAVRAAGVPVPEVVAAGEWIGPAGRLQSFLALEELHGMLPLHHAVPQARQCLDGLAFRHWKDGLIRELARLVRLLHDRRWFHKDLYLCHFYIAEAETERVPPSWRGRVYLIDFHRLRRHRWTWPMWRLKDLAGLLFSSATAGVTPRDRLRFWQLYCDGGNRSWGARLWARLIRFKSERYRHHNAKRRASASLVSRVPR